MRTNTLRTVKGYSLNKGTGMAKGLYNISHEDGRLSLWFPESPDLLKCSDEKFVETSEHYLLSD